jgi:aspartate 4-decarboxylase
VTGGHDAHAEPGATEVDADGQVHADGQVDADVAAVDPSDKYAKLSPFELKAALLEVAAASAARNHLPLLDAGRGNPNWVASRPREAFFLLGNFALGEGRATWNEGILIGQPKAPGIAERLASYLAYHHQSPGSRLLEGIVAHGVDRGFEPDAWVHELVDGIIGDHYPGPDRMLVHAEKIVREYLVDELCGGVAPDSFDLFAVEGGTAAMCYVFDSLTTNGLLDQGDRVALMVPAFTPYLEIPKLDRYGFDVLELRATAVGPAGEPNGQYLDTEIDHLSDPSIKALFVINPANPGSVMLAPGTVNRLAKVVMEDNPELIIVSDDVYSTFVPGFRSLLADLPRNTIGVYSFSKYFGCTGWRLGVVALAKDNVIDDRLRAEDNEDHEVLARRYETITTNPTELAFIDRMVADSRQVALNHTAGLSLPQQVQMTLFAGAALVDLDDVYRTRTREIVNHRLANLYRGLGIDLPDDPLRAGYYAELDLLAWARTRYEPGFAEWLVVHHDPLDPLFHLAEEDAIVLLNGGGFEGPEWSVRVSLANLPDEAYLRIGAELATVFDGFQDEYRADVGTAG